MSRAPSALDDDNEFLTKASPSSRKARREEDSYSEGVGNPNVVRILGVISVAGDRPRRRYT